MTCHWHTKRQIKLSALRVSTKSTLSIVSILLKQNRFASAQLCGTRKQVFDLFKLMHEWLFHRPLALKHAILLGRYHFACKAPNCGRRHADMCAVSITGSQIPFGNTYRCRSIFFRFAFLRIKLGKLFVFQTFPPKRPVCIQSENCISNRTVLFVCRYSNSVYKKS